MSSSTIARMNLLLSSWDKDDANTDSIEVKTTEICTGEGCSLSISSSTEYQYGGDCRPGNLCSEFRILKEKSRGSNYESSARVRSFEVFKSL